MKIEGAWRWVLLGGMSCLAACGGVSNIGSGDATGGKSGTPTGVGHAGSSSQAGAGIDPSGMPGMGTGTGTGTPGTEDPSGKPTPGGMPAIGGAGSGGGSPAGACMTDTDCPDPRPCEMCADGSTACEKIHCQNGMCVNLGTSCEPMCKLDQDCPMDAGPCLMCGDGSKVCPRSECAAGHCRITDVSCPPDDVCKGMPCGTQCERCLGPGCSPPTKPFYCSADGHCDSVSPQCGGAMCSTTMDCGSAPPNCIDCGGGTCAAFECLKGVCALTCPPNPTPECKVNEDCPVREICKMCADGKCAATACLSGSCELVCPL